VGNLQVLEPVLRCYHEILTGQRECNCKSSDQKDREKQKNSPRKTAKGNKLLFFLIFFNVMANVSGGVILIIVVTIVMVIKATIIIITSLSSRSQSP
jgi:hypothetical protein